MNEIGERNVIKDYLNDIKKIDIVQDLQLMTWPFCLSTELWENYENRRSEIDFKNLNKIKYFDGETLSEEINILPTDKGGVYIYVLENSVLECAGSYIMYVGRARKTNAENLRARAKSHYSKYVRHEENERLEKLFDKWKKYVYLLYLPLEGNPEIDLAEKELILALTPPCNKDYPAPKVRRKLSGIFYI